MTVTTRVEGQRYTYHRTEVSKFTRNPNIQEEYYRSHQIIFYEIRDVDEPVLVYMEEGRAASTTEQLNALTPEDAQQEIKRLRSLPTGTSSASR